MLEKLYNVGDDALSNLFKIVVPPNDYIGNTEELEIRIQDFTVPESGANTYERHYQGAMINKPSGKPNAPKEVSFTFAIDRNYTLYKGFVNWKNNVIDTKTGQLRPDIPSDNARATFTVYPTDGNGDKVEGFGKWVIEKAFPLTVGEVGFDYTSGDPVTCSITLSALAIDDTKL